MCSEQGSGRGRRETQRHRGHGEVCPGQNIRKMREIHYRNSRDPPLRLCVFAPLRLLLRLALNLEEGIEDRFADVVEFRLKMIDEFMQSVIHDLFDVQKF